MLAIWIIIFVCVMLIPTLYISLMYYDRPVTSKHSHPSRKSTIVLILYVIMVISVAVYFQNLGLLY